MAVLGLQMLLLAVAATIGGAVYPAQQPLGVDLSAASSWKLNFSSAAPHYFHSVHSLLQQWPNTYFPNGHALAAGTIPAFTKLYHGRVDADVPASPEWLAFDIDMSYGIMGSNFDSHMLTYQTTRAVRALYFDGESAALMGTGQLDTQMLHIYGNASGPPGSGRFRGLWPEYARAIGLCGWIKAAGLGGTGWGVEAVVRMNAGFELIWCNFTSPSLRLISHLNVTVPLLGEAPDSDEQATRSSIEESPRSYFPLPPVPTKTDLAAEPTTPNMPPNWRRDTARQPFLRSQGWQWFKSATRHYGSSASGAGLGEHRVKVNTCHVLSYYDPRFEDTARTRAKTEQRSLNLTSEGLWLGSRDADAERDTSSSRRVALAQLTRRRRSHTLGGVSRPEALAMRQASEEMLQAMVSKGGNQCSGMDWSSVTTDIITSYSHELYSLEQLFRLYSDVASDNYTATRRYISNIRSQLHVFMLPFLEYPVNAANQEVWSANGRLYNATFARCKYHHTRLLDPALSLRPALNPSEAALKSSVEEVMSTICSVTLGIGFPLEHLFAVYFNAELSPPEQKHWRLDPVVRKRLRHWTAGVEELKAWLGWASEWTRCEKVCAWDEVCYIPMWPLIARNTHAMQSPTLSGGEAVEDGVSIDDGMSGVGPDAGEPDRGPGRGRGPGYGYGRPPGYGGRRPPMRGGMDERDLWEPKCIKEDYIMGR